jgi:hypothetical protein
MNAKSSIYYHFVKKTSGINHTKESTQTDENDRNIFKEHNNHLIVFHAQLIMQKWEK